MFFSSGMSFDVEFVKERILLLLLKETHEISQYKFQKESGTSNVLQLISM